MISFVFTDEDVKFVDQFCLHLKSVRKKNYGGSQKNDVAGNCQGLVGSIAGMGSKMIILCQI